MLFEGEAEQFGAAQRGPGPTTVVPRRLVRRLPQLSGEPGHLVDRRRVEVGEFPAEQHLPVGGRLVRLVEDRRDRAEVNSSPAAQQCGDPLGPLVGDVGERVGQGGALCAYLLDGGVVRPGGA